jgi:hypothetical protein
MLDKYNTPTHSLSTVPWHGWALMSLVANAREAAARMANYPVLDYLCISQRSGYNLQITLDSTICFSLLQDAVDTAVHSALLRRCTREEYMLHHLGRVFSAAPPVASLHLMKPSQMVAVCTLSPPPPRRWYSVIETSSRYPLTHRFEEHEDEEQEQGQRRKLLLFTGAEMALQFLRCRKAQGAAQCPTSAALGAQAASPPQRQIHGQWFPPQRAMELVRDEKFDVVIVEHIELPSVEDHTQQQPQQQPQQQRARFFIKQYSRDEFLAACTVHEMQQEVQKKKEEQTQ